MYFIIAKDVISHSLRVMNYTRKLCKCFLQEKNAQSCKEKYTILQEKVHKKCVFFY